MSPTKYIISVTTLLSAYTKFVIIATENYIKIATILICVPINSEKIDTNFSELPILNNIDKNNALNDTINGNKNFLNTFFREAK